MGRILVLWAEALMIYSQVVLALRCHGDTYVLGSRIPVTSPQAVKDLCACRTASGNFVLNDPLAGDISLDGLEEVTAGLLDIQAPNITSLSSDTFRQVSRLRVISAGVKSVKFPRLSVAQTLDLYDSPNIEHVELGPEVTSSSIGITGTKLSQLPSIYLHQEYNSFGLSIRENKNLIGRFAPRVQDNTSDYYFDSLLVEGNNPEFSVDVSFVTTAEVVSFGDMKQTPYVPRLREAHMLDLRDNTFSEFAAPLISASVIRVCGNSKLDSLNLPVLEHIDISLTIYNNPLLADVSFDNLRTAKGYIAVSGNFRTLRMPALQNVTEELIIESTDPGFNCSETIAPIVDKVHGMVVCNGEVLKNGTYYFYLKEHPFFECKS